MQPPTRVTWYCTLGPAAALAILTQHAAGQTPQQTPSAPQPATSIAARTAGSVRRDGFLPIYLDARQGKLLVELPRDSTRALFFASQATGLGSNQVGIDRGAGAVEQLARFEREGDRVLVIFENWSYRSSATSESKCTIFPQEIAFPLRLFCLF